jgi:hypothetical protein
MRPSPDWLDHWRVQSVVPIDVEQPVNRRDDAQQHDVTHDEKRNHEDRDIAQGEIFEHFCQEPPQETRPYKPSSVGFIPMSIDRLHHADPAISTSLRAAASGSVNWFGSTNFRGRDSMIGGRSAL